MGTSKYYESMGSISLCLSVRVESVSSNYHRCAVRVTATRQRDATRVDIVKSEEIGKLSSGSLLNNCQGRGHF